MSQDCQFLSRTGPWYWSYKNDGVMGYMISLGNGVNYVICDDYVKAFKMVFVSQMVIQIEILSNGDIIFVQFLMFNGIKPSNWRQSMGLLSHFCSPSKRNPNPLWKVGFMKQWDVVNQDNISKIFESPIPLNVDGYVFQLATSPPPRLLDNDVSEKEYGSAYYFKNCQPFHVTYDIQIDLSYVNEVKQEWEYDPPCIGLPSGFHGNKFVCEVYKDDNGENVFVRKRTNKKPNSKMVLDRLRDAALKEEIIVAFKTRNVDIIDCYYDPKRPLWRMTQVERLIIASTYPARMNFINNITDKEEICYYDFRLSCLKDVFYGNYDNIFLNKSVFGDYVMDIIEKGLGLRKEQGSVIRKLTGFKF